MPMSTAALLDADDERWVLRGDDLPEQVDALAAQLADQGITPGAAVALLLDHEPETVLAFLAVLRCNACAIPLNPQLHPHEMGALLATREPVLIVVGEEPNPVGRELSAQIDVPLETITSGSGARLAGRGTSSSGRLPEPDPEAIALLLHTSGTTGRPKAVPLRQRNLAASAVAIADGYGLGAEDVSYCLMPLFHVHGLVASVLAALASGGTVVVPRRLRPRAVWEHAERHKVTWFSAVPTILAKLPPRETAGPPLRFVRSCSSALAPSLWTTLEERFGVPVIEAYGMTEASHQMATNPLPPGERRPGTVGTPAGAEVRIVDKTWASLGPNTPGEVVVRGSGVVDGYLDNDAANAESFQDGWFRTGDVGHLSDDGYLTLDGRVKEMINRGGEKIAPREIDEALLLHPAVVDAVAFGRPDNKWGEVVEAVVVLKAPATPDELREHCSERLAAFKVPRTVHVVNHIPKGPTGKVQRQLLAKEFSA
jgi:acyl-CoA synthetase (AMP-forming)/AMP-acid ligase II